jgi:phage anti-repressor protein
MVNMSDNVDDAIKHVKRFTSVPERFVDELFRFYKIDTSQRDAVILLDYVATWLDMRKSNLHRTLTRTYVKGVDYIVERGSNPNKTEGQRASNNYLRVLITPDCFKRLCMLSRTKKAEVVRTYFIDVETQFLRYHAQLLEGMRHDLNPKRGTLPHGNTGGYIYVIRASEAVSTMFKVGRAAALKARLFSYQTGKAHEVDLLYVYAVHNMRSAERCVKAALEEFQYRKRREVYQVPLDLIKEVVVKCDAIDGAKKEYVRRKALSGGGGSVFFAVFNKALVLPP